jgi:hypothetical protein
VRVRLVAVLVAAAACIAAGLLVVLSHHQPRLTGVNDTGPAQIVRTLSRHVRATCQSGEITPGKTTGVAFALDTRGRPRPALTVRVLAAGRTVSTGRLAAGPPAGLVTVPIRPGEGTRTGSTICLAAAGTEPVDLIGAGGGRWYIQYWRGGRPSAWAMLPSVAHRFGQAKASFEGPWTFVLVVLLVLGAAGTAAMTLVKAAR